MKSGPFCGIFSVLLIVGCSAPLNDERPEPPHAQKVPLDQDPSPVGDTWRDVRGANAKPAAAAVAMAAGVKFADAGIPAQYAGLLQADVQAVLESMFTPSFDAYQSLMESKDCHLDEMATAFARAMKDWKIYESMPEARANSSTAEQIKFFWNRPGPRFADWREVRLDSVACGAGLTISDNSADWPYDGAYGQASLFAPSSGRLSERDGTWLDESGDWKAAWVVVEGRFISGMQTRMRINFYFDTTLEKWIPVTLVYGLDGEYRPFGMI